MAIVTFCDVQVNFDISEILCVRIPIKRSALYVVSLTTDNVHPPVDHARQGSVFFLKKGVGLGLKVNIR